MVHRTKAAKRYVIGIAGGTGSGKTTLANEIARRIGRERVTILDADAYYKDLIHIPPEERNKINFDHPDAVDIALLRDHILALKSGRAINKPNYDYTTHCRAGNTTPLPSRAVVVVEGILVLSLSEIHPLFDLKIFVDEASDIRLIRRIHRDMAVRGRSLESILHQYVKTVMPMFDAFVAPSRKNAHIVVNPRKGVEAVICVIEQKSGLG